MTPPFFSPRPSLMQDPEIAIVHSRGIEGLGTMAELKGPIGLPFMKFSAVLNNEFTTDAHFQTYQAVDESGKVEFFRARKISPMLRQLRAAGCRMEATILALDLDLEDEHSSHRPWRSRGEVTELCEKLRVAAIPPPTAFYTTKNGARFVYLLSEPIDVERSERVGAGLREIYHAAGIAVDDACRDWTRLYRLPKVIRDNAPSWTAETFMLLQGGPTLDVNSIPEVNLGTSNTYSEIDVVGGDMPDPDECRNILWKTSESTGRQIMTPWHKVAKSALRPKTWHAYLFDGQALDLSLGRDNQLTQWIGGTIGALISEENASPEFIYALFDEPVSGLEPDAGTPDWRLCVWEKVLRFWNAEMSKHAALVEESQIAQVEAQGLEGDILRAMRRSCPVDELLNSTDRATALAAMRGRLIAASPKGFYVCKPDGNYSTLPVDKTRLPAHIRHLGMDGVIELQKVEGWNVKSIAAQELLDRHAITVGRIECSPRPDGSYIEGQGDARTLILQVHQLRADLLATAREEPAITEWLKQLAGPKYPRLLEWLSHVLDATRPICSLNMVGASGAGKNMLVDGIAECFEHPFACGSEAMGEFNHSLINNPVIHMEEGIPTGYKGKKPDEVLRALISGGNIGIQPKGVDTYHCRIYPRIVFSSNDLDILSSLCGRRDLTEEDIAAIEIRLLHLDIREDAQRWLTARGNRLFTRGWIAGDQASQFVLARHILWLYKNRQPSSTGSGRLLVEGERQSRILRDMALRTPVARAVVRAIIEMIEKNVSYDGFACEDANIYTVPHAIVQYWEGNLSHVTKGADLNDRSVGRVLRLVSTGEKPRICSLKSKPGAPRQRWWHLNLVPLLYEAVSAGYKRLRLEAIFEQAHGIEERNRILDEFGGSITMEQDPCLNKP